MIGKAGVAFALYGLVDGTHTGAGANVKWSSREEVKDACHGGLNLKGWNDC